jgi:hypothetical protein
VNCLLLLLDAWRGSYTQEVHGQIFSIASIPWKDRMHNLWRYGDTPFDNDSTALTTWDGVGLFLVLYTGTFGFPGTNLCPLALAPTLNRHLLLSLSVTTLLLSCTSGDDAVRDRVHRGAEHLGGCRCSLLDQLRPHRLLRLRHPAELHAPNRRLGVFSRRHF